MKNIISVDAMGGDFGPSVIIPACIDFLIRELTFSIILVGDSDAINKALAKSKFLDKKRLLIQHATEVVGSDELPTHALRNKKDSSMRVAINLLKEGRASACVSAGNTGALMATAKFVLKTIPGIDRPALLARVPGESGSISRLLDVGASIGSSVNQLVQFSIMGHVVAKHVGAIDSPIIALLNVGEEDIKGNLTVKETSAELKKLDFLNYVGYVEGNDIFTDKCDVVVTEGFAGNICLKTVEGTATMISTWLRKSLKKNIFNRFLSVFCLPILLSLKKEIDPRIYNGGSFLGLPGVVVKSHGNADRVSFGYALNEAKLEIEKNIPALLEQYFNNKQDCDPEAV